MTLLQTKIVKALHESVENPKVIYEVHDRPFDMGCAIMNGEFVNYDPKWTHLIIDAMREDITNSIRYSELSL